MNMILFQITKTVLITHGSYIKISRKYKQFLWLRRGTIANEKLFHIQKQTLLIKRVSLYMNTEILVYSDRQNNSSYSLRRMRDRMKDYQYIIIYYVYVLHA